MRGLLGVGAQSWAEAPADPAPFRGRAIPLELRRTPRGGVRLSLDGRAGVVGMFAADRSAANTCPATRTCVVIRDAGAPGAVSSHHVFARGELFVTRAVDADLTVNAEGPGRYRVDVKTLDKPVLLTLRPTLAPTIELSDGYGQVAGGVGSRTEGRVSGVMTFRPTSAGGDLVLRLNWRGKRFFGWVGGKSRTLTIPTRTLISARWTRKAEMISGQARIGERQLIELSWRVPAEDQGRGRRPAFRAATARFIADVPAPSREQLGLLDFLVRRGRDVVKRDCCYPESSLSGFLRFQRRAESGIGLCAESRRCTDEELEWFDRR